MRLSNLREQDLQGEREAVAVLREMGADIVRDGDVLTVRGGRPLHAVTRDGDGFTDAVQALTGRRRWRTARPPGRTCTRCA